MKHYAAAGANSVIIGTRSTENKTYTHAILTTWRVSTQGTDQVTFFQEIRSWHNGPVNAQKGLAEAQRGRNGYRVDASGRQLWDYDAEDLARPAVQIVSRTSVEIVPAIETPKRLAVGGILLVEETGGAL